MTDPLAPKNIVIVEDSPDLCESWREIFELDGHTVHCFGGSNEALQARELVRQADVLLTDYYLPDRNGLQLIEEVRKIRNDIAVVLITGSRESFIKDGLQKYSRAAIIYKPVNFDEVERTLGTLLN